MGDVGRRITQPSFGGILVATIERGILNKDVDAAVARLDNSRRYTCGVQDIGAIAGTAAPELGMAVRKRGRSTGLTYGTIHGLDRTVQVPFAHGVGTIIFRNQVEIYPDTTRNSLFADQGDSGSVIVNDAGQVVALLFAIDSDSKGTGTATPIHTVLEQLDVSMAIEGIGGFDVSSSADQAFALDYTGAGRSNHLVLYSPGKGIAFILKKDGPGTFSPAYQSHSGIGGFDLSSPDDRAFPLDYTGTGNSDHLVFYRPGKGIIFILKKDGAGGFTPVYQSHSGIGGFDLSVSADNVFAFDYDGTGTTNHLVLYRPGTGALYIIKKDGTGNYYPVYHQNPGGSGIGGYDLSSSADRAFAFDYGGTGKSDHLVLYRPGKGIVFILKKDGAGTFSPVYRATK